MNVCTQTSNVNWKFSFFLVFFKVDKKLVRVEEPVSSLALFVCLSPPPSPDLRDTKSLHLNQLVLTFRWIWFRFWLVLAVEREGGVVVGGGGDGLEEEQLL